MSQPALSVSIAQLERQLGVRLFDRGPQGSVLSEFGEVLVRHAKALDTVLKTAEAEVSLRKLGVAGVLNIGGSPIALSSLVPRALGVMDQSGARIFATLEEGTEEDLTASLRENKFDLVVCSVSLDAVSPDIEEEPLVRIKLDIVVRPDSPYADCQSISLSDLRDARWAMPFPGGVFRRQVEAVFLTAGERFPSATLLCGSMASLKAVASCTDSVALLPREAVALESRVGTLKVIPLVGPPADRFLGIRRRRGQDPSPLGMRFTQALRAVAKEWG